MKHAQLNFLFVLIICCGCAVHKDKSTTVDKRDVGRIIATLSDDNMRGRAIFTQDIERAADFISDEFEQAGLKPFRDLPTFRQDFTVSQIQPATQELTINGKAIDAEKMFYISTQTGINWNTAPNVNLEYIRADDDFMERFRALRQLKTDVLVIVDEQFAEHFAKVHAFYSRGRIIPEPNRGANNSIVFVLNNQPVQSFRVSITNSIEKMPLFNVVGVLPGKSKPDEYVIFSGHYDHLGIIDPVGRDSIANGADDDASGITAVISLAKHYARMKDNERTLLFVAFTAEESGGFGSQFFSKQLNPDKVKAMINIEMIGKDSKFGSRTAYITGYEKSNLGKLLQGQLTNTAFAFHPDPYPEQNLFYRSDNATLAALGVPAHTISTVQIDQDQYYHTVKDELKTLDVKNILSTIQAIALGARGIVAGTETPTRIEKNPNLR